MKLESISELLNFLNPNKRDVRKCLEAMKSLDVDSLKMKGYTFWNKEGYTRNLISKTESFELFACCWEPGQASRLHDLNGQTGWIKVVQGELDFGVANLNEGENPVVSSIENLKAGDLFTQQGKKQMYQMENNSNQRAISLHLYSLPITYYNVLNGSGTDVENLNIVYHSINGTLI